MTYRNDSDALRERVQKLEGDLASANETIERLKGETAETSPGTQIEHSRFVDGPSLFAREELLPYEISEEGYEQIADVLRTRLAATNVSQVGRTLTVPGVFSLTREGTSTRIRMTGTWSHLKQATLAFGGLAGFFGGLMSAGVLADIANHGGPWYLPFFVLGIAPALAGGAMFLGRKRSAKHSKNGLEKLQGTFETILSVAQEHRVPPAVRARVEDVDADEAEEEVEAEAAEHEAER